MTILHRPRPADLAVHTRSPTAVCPLEYSNVKPATSSTPALVVGRGTRPASDITCSLQANMRHSTVMMVSNWNYSVEGFGGGHSSTVVAGKMPVEHEEVLAMKHKQQRRSDCPINFALEVFGDPWSLLIIRDIVYFGKKTYGEFLASEEGMATNILADRLAYLERQGLFMKRRSGTARRREGQS